MAIEPVTGLGVGFIVLKEVAAPVGHLNKRHRSSGKICKIGGRRSVTLPGLVFVFANDIPIMQLRTATEMAERSAGHRIITDVRLTGAFPSCNVNEMVFPAFSETIIGA